MKKIGLAMLLGAVVFSGSRLATGQVLTVKKIGDKTVLCMRSGLMSELNDCGLHSAWYTYVFVGKIAAVRPANQDEFQVEIVPEEVFAGAPGKTITILTSQGICLPRLVVGDEWLFYLRRVEAKPVVLDYYGNDSLPISQAQGRIATLRRLRSIGPAGILRGTVLRGSPSGGKSLPNAKVVARRLDGAQFVTTAGPDGRYEFKSLPTGSYKVEAISSDSYRTQSVELDIKRGECWDLTLSKGAPF